MTNINKAYEILTEDNKTTVNQLVADYIALTNADEAKALEEVFDFYASQRDMNLEEFAEFVINRQDHAFDSRRKFDDYLEDIKKGYYTLEIGNSGRQPAHAAEITGTDDKYKFDRDFLEADEEGPGYLIFNLENGKVYAYKESKEIHYIKVENCRAYELSEAEVEEYLNQADEETEEIEEVEKVEVKETEETKEVKEEKENKTSEAQLRASRRWEERNREKAREANYRRSAKLFVRRYATAEDMEELRELFEKENENYMKMPKTKNLAEVKNIEKIKKIIGQELELLELVYKLEDLGYKSAFRGDNLHSLILGDEKITVCNDNDEKINILFEVVKFQTEEIHTIVKVTDITAY